MNAKTKLVLLLTILIFSTITLIWAWNLRDEIQAERLKEYHVLVNKLQSKGFDFKEANYIALVESGYREPDSLYYEYLNHQKKH